MGYKCFKKMVIIFVEKSGFKSTLISKQCQKYTVDEFDVLLKLSCDIELAFLRPFKSIYWIWYFKVRKTSFKGLTYWFIDRDKTRRIALPRGNKSTNLWGISCVHTYREFENGYTWFILIVGHSAMVGYLILWFF